MATISNRHFIENLEAALQYISAYHPPEFVAELTRAYEREEGPAAKNRSPRSWSIQARQDQPPRDLPGCGNRQYQPAWRRRFEGDMTSRRNLSFRDPLHGHPQPIHCVPPLSRILCSAASTPVTTRPDTDHQTRLAATA
ncbi:MAG: hypothetical protein R3C04_09050 [Hyphomonas sp.]